MDPPPPLPPSAQTLPSTVAPTPAAAAAATAAAIQPNYPDSVESSPRSRIAETWNDEPLPLVPGAKLRLMCSYGGHIMPRPHDKSLCYVGGDTRIVVVDRNSTLKDLCLRLSRTLLNGRPFTLKYQLPNEDLDNLITVTTDEDLDNMIEEYDRVAAASSSSSSSASPLKPSPSRLRVFLFFSKPESSVSMGSLLDDAKSETWFVDALNNSGILTRGVSDSAAGDSFVNLDGVSVGVGVGGGSSNNLEAQGLADNINGGNNNNKVKNLQEVGTVNSLPESSSSPSMANLPPIRVRVDENVGSRLQQEQRIGVMEDQFAQMTIGASGGGGGGGVVRQDDGYVVVPSAVAMPAIPAQSVTMASSAAMVSINNVDNMNRVVSDDERSDPGVPLGYRKPPLPLQLVQPRTSGGVNLPSPDSVASDSSSIASTNSFSKNVYYQEQVQPSHVDNKPQALNNTRTEVPDQIPTLQREQIQESGYTIPQQFDQNQQLQQQQFVHASTHYIHHPTAPTATVPVSSYYQVYAPQSQPQLHHPQISQQQYPVYVMPVGHTQLYNVTLQPNISDPNVVAASSGRTIVPQSVAPPTTGTPPIYPPRQNTPTTIPDVNVNVNPTSVYQAPVASNPAFVQIPSNQFQQQYVGLPPQVHHHHPAQQIAVATSGGTNAYGYEYGGGNVQDQQGYYTQQTSTVPLASQYQSMTPAAAAAALSDASKQFPNNDNIQQPNRTSQPV